MMTRNMAIIAITATIIALAPGLFTGRADAQESSSTGASGWFQDCRPAAVGDYDPILAFGRPGCPIHWCPDVFIQGRESVRKPLAVLGRGPEAEDRTVRWPAAHDGLLQRQSQAGWRADTSVPVGPERDRSRR